MGNPGSAPALAHLTFNLIEIPFSSCCQLNSQCNYFFFVSYFAASFWTILISDFSWLLVSWWILYLRILISLPFCCAQRCPSLFCIFLFNYLSINDFTNKTQSNTSDNTEGTTFEYQKCHCANLLLWRLGMFIDCSTEGQCIESRNSQIDR